MEIEKSSTEINNANEKNIEIAPKGKKLTIILLIGIIAVAAILALILGLAIGLKKNKKKYNKLNIMETNKVDIVNSYNNTNELSQKYPVENPTTIKNGLEKNIQNRLLTGFENWNRGFDAWKAWGDILYTNDSIYNVHGARLTLEQYQKSMDITLKQTKIYMGNFHNMLINDEFTAIYYDIITTYGNRNVSGTVMEFVKFKDYEGNLGTRVVEGWGGTKDQSYNSMIIFQGEEEKRVQKAENDYMLNYTIPETDNLKDKYPINYPSNYIDENADQILDIILKGFDNWNQGIENYTAWVNDNYNSDAKSVGLNRKERNMTEYLEEMDEILGKYYIEKLYFDNILIRDNWAALHYRYRNKTFETNGTEIGDRMQFLQFEQVGDKLKINGSWIK